ncbi:OmpA family protein [bacterium AH-315-C07]|nr:OmpA family protein [bacterium AH-315-C07]
MLLGGEGCRTKSKKALKYYNEAISYLRLRNYARAKELLDESISKDESFADAHYTLAEIARSEYDYRKAEQGFKTVIELCPEFSIRIYFTLGLVYFEIGEYENCMFFLKEFIERSSQRKNQKHVHRAKQLIEKAGFLKKMYDNPVPFEPVSIKGLSTPYNEYLAIISPDNELVFYTKQYLKKDLNVSYKQDWSEEFFYGKREGKYFSSCKPMKFPFNSGNNEGGATITIDNKHLYFTACNRAGSLGNCDIFYSKISNGKWSTIRNAGAIINSRDWDSQPSISSDGKVLYFASMREGGYGGSDLYMSFKDSLGNWGEIINMGPKINTPGNEKSPFIHQDSETLYFSSDGLMGMGGMDIFYARTNKEGQFMDPVNIGYPINSEENDIGFFVSTDGRKGYFASDKLEGEGGWDIYSFVLYEAARPQQVLFLKGALKNDKGKPIKGAKIEMINTITNEKFEVPLDSSGKYVMVMKFEEDMVMNIKTPDKIPITHYISKEDTVFLKPRTIDIEVKPLAVGETFVLNSIYFKVDSFALEKRSLFELKNVIEFLNFKNKVKFEILGHTDSSGDPEENKLLSNNRARSVYEYLTENGIDKDRLSYKGFGASKPVASNETTDGKAKNRRTEFVILEK